jgi:hypothetical protein
MWWLREEQYGVMFSLRARVIRKLILYSFLLIYTLVHAFQPSHDLLGYSVYGLTILLLTLELIDALKEMTRAHKGS